MNFARAVAAITALCAIAFVQAEPLTVALKPSGVGSFYVPVHINEHVSADFLLDTGASITVVNERVLRQLDNGHRRKPVRRVAMRLASGRLQPVDVYEVDSLRISEMCVLGPLEVAVMPGADRNILGLNALVAAGSFSMVFEPPSLSLGHCAPPTDPARNLAIH